MSPHHKQRFPRISLHHEDVIACSRRRGHDAEIPGFRHAHADVGEESFCRRRGKFGGLTVVVGVDESEKGAHEVVVFFLEGGLRVCAGFKGAVGGVGGDVEGDFAEGGAVVGYGEFGEPFGGFVGMGVRGGRVGWGLGRRLGRRV